MAQKRYHNFEQPLESLHENNRLGNLIHPGVYAGYDNMEVVSGTGMKVKHDISGAIRTNEDANGTQGPFGIVVSRQGTVIEDDQEFNITVPYITAKPRIDLIIAQHTHLESVGGSAMVIGRIQGAEADYPIAPDLDNPLIQVIVGYLKVTIIGSHSGTKFYPAARKSLGGYFGINRKDQFNFDRAYSDDFNEVTLPGIWGVVTSSANPGNRPSNNNSWALMVFRSQNTLAQVAIAANGGRVYTRAANQLTGNIVPAGGWLPWQSLNNAEVNGPDLTGIINAIGDLTYDEENVVNTGESLTASINFLDIAYNLLNISLGTTASTVTANSASITSLQNKWEEVATSGPLSNLNLATSDCQKFFSSGTTNEPPGNVSYGILNVATSGNVIQQWVRYPSGLVYFRVSTNLGFTWGGWGLKEYAKAAFPMGNWNMDSTGSITITHGLNAAKVRKVSAWVLNDAGTRVYDLTQSGSSSLGTNEVSGQILIDTADIVLARTNSGIFDSTNFDDASGLPSTNRGQVLIEYEA